MMHTLVRASERLDSARHRQVGYRHMVAMTRFVPLASALSHIIFIVYIIYIVL